MPESKAIHFRPHGDCRRQLAELAAMTNGDVTTVINRAVAELYQSEIAKQRRPETVQEETR